MTTPMNVDELEALAAKVQGWRSLGNRRSSGETMCAGCWDRSNHDTKADHEIPSGHRVFWTAPHPEYGDCDAYCASCVIEDAENEEIISTAEASIFRAHIERTRND